MAEEHCICCGSVIPEGRQVCANCENGVVKTMTYCSKDDGCTMCEREMCDGDREKHLRCASCEYIYWDRSLEYYPVNRCKKANDKEVKFNAENGWERMKWCPLFPGR